MFQESMFAESTVTIPEQAHNPFEVNAVWSDADLMQGRQLPSVDAQGNITFIPTHSSHKSPNREALLGTKARVITCLQTSHKKKHTPCKETGKKGWLELITRVYSMKDGSKKSGKLVAHDSRFIMTNCHTETNESVRQDVIATGSKTPHAYIVGTVSEFVGQTNPNRHNEIIEDMKSKGAFYVAYEPYKKDSFMVTGQNKKTPSKAICEELPEFSFSEDQPFTQAYFTEDAILVLP